MLGMLMTEFRCWWHLLNVGAQRQCKKIVDVGDRNGQNLNHYLKVHRTFKMFAAWSSRSKYFWGFGPFGGSLTPATKIYDKQFEHPVKTWVRKFPGHLVIINREHAPKAPLSKRLLQSLLYCYNSKIVFVMSVHVWFSRCKSRWICSRWSFGFSMVLW